MTSAVMVATQDCFSFKAAGRSPCAHSAPPYPAVAIANLPLPTVLSRVLRCKIGGQRQLGLELLNRSRKVVLVLQKPPDFVVDIQQLLFPTRIIRLLWRQLRPPLQLGPELRYRAGEIV